MMVTPSRGVYRMVRLTCKGCVHDGQTLKGCVHDGQTLKGCVHSGQTLKGCVVHVLEDLRVISYEHILNPENKITPLHIISLRDHLFATESLCVV